MKRLISILVVLCWLHIGASAQDLHFTQNHYIPAYTNPAYSTLFNGDYRFSGIIRNQWRSVTKPYTSTALGFDGKLQRQYINNMNLGGGIVILNDQAGDSQYSTTGSLFNLNASFNPGNDSVHFVYVGLQPGIFQRSINFDKLKFDNQYNGSIFDPTLPTGEQFGSSNFTYFDLGLGLAWHYVINDRLNTTLGYSQQHLNKANQTFFDNVEVPLQQKKSITADANYVINNLFTVQPMFLYQEQNEFNQILTGGLINYKMTNPKLQNAVIQTGFLYRNKDAFSVLMGYRFNNYNFGLAYDINVSSLSQASNGRGAIEFGINYIITTVKPICDIKVCPIY
ncbi:MAG: PorP/SprF family type IX secretion system membrane protein [Bacteroidia bacterium]|nr:PorP/SprF family type IX secretion system membrane protein [Bacteroidia bacterium]